MSSNTSLSWLGGGNTQRRCGKELQTFSISVCIQVKWNTNLMQVGVSFDLYYDARKHKIKMYAFKFIGSNSSCRISTHLLMALLLVTAVNIGRVTTTGTLWACQFWRKTSKTDISFNRLESSAFPQTEEMKVWWRETCLF